MSWINKLGNKLLSSLFSLLFNKNIGDTQSGFRAIRRKLLNDLTYRDYGMPYVTEQLIHLVKKGTRIVEVPITYRPRKGETKLNPLIDGVKILTTIIKGRFFN
jgi:dolichol-phosphate mannosyltransferase